MSVDPDDRLLPPAPPDHTTSPLLALDAAPTDDVDLTSPSAALSSALSPQDSDTSASAHGRHTVRLDPSSPIFVPSSARSSFRQAQLHAGSASAPSQLGIEDALRLHGAATVSWSHAPFCSTPSTAHFATPSSSILGSPSRRRMLDDAPFDPAPSPPPRRIHLDLSPLSHDARRPYSPALTLTSRGSSSPSAFSCHHPHSPTLETLHRVAECAEKRRSARATLSALRAPTALLDDELPRRHAEEGEERGQEPADEAAHVPLPSSPPPPPPPTSGDAAAAATATETPEEQLFSFVQAAAQLRLSSSPSPPAANTDESSTDSCTTPSPSPSPAPIVTRLASPSPSKSAPASADSPGEAASCEMAGSNAQTPSEADVSSGEPACGADSPSEGASYKMDSTSDESPCEVDDISTPVAKPKPTALGPPVASFTAKRKALLASRRKRVGEKRPSEAGEGTAADSPSAQDYGETPSRVAQWRRCKAQRAHDHEQEALRVARDFDGDWSSYSEHKRSTAAMHHTIQQIAQECAAKKRAEQEQQREQEEQPQQPQTSFTVITDTAEDLEALVNVIQRLADSSSSNGEETPEARSPCDAVSSSLREQVEPPGPTADIEPTPSAPTPPAPAPPASAPSSSAPSASTASASTSSASTSSTSTSSASAPSTSAPSTSAPSTSAPSGSAPPASAPSASDAPAGAASTHPAEKSAATKKGKGKKNGKGKKKPKKSEAASHVPVTATGPQPTTAQTPAKVAAPTTVKSTSRDAAPLAVVAPEQKPSAEIEDQVYQPRPPKTGKAAGRRAAKQKAQKAKSASAEEITPKHVSTLATETTACKQPTPAQPKVRAHSSSAYQP